jgi:hypothetical protein
VLTRKEGTPARLHFFMVLDGTFPIEPEMVQCNHIRIGLVARICRSQLSLKMISSDKAGVQFPDSELLFCFLLVQRSL